MSRRQPKTDNHERVYAHLLKAGAPLSAYQILEALHDEGFRTPVTIYRALDRLVGEGRVHRLESMNAFVPCCDPDHRHAAPAFAICDECGTVGEIVRQDLLDHLRACAEVTGFAVARAAVELRGRCADCVAKANER